MWKLDHMNNHVSLTLLLNLNHLFNTYELDTCNAMPRTPIIMPKMPAVMPKMPAVMWGLGHVCIQPCIAIQLSAVLCQPSWDHIASCFIASEVRFGFGLVDVNVHVTRWLIFHEHVPPTCSYCDLEVWQVPVNGSWVVVVVYRSCESIPCCSGFQGCVKCKYLSHEFFVLYRVVMWSWFASVHIVTVTVLSTMDALQGGNIEMTATDTMVPR